MSTIVPQSKELRDMMRELKATGGLFETAEQEAEYDALIAADIEAAINAVIDAERRYARIKKAAKEAQDYLEMVSEDLRNRVAKQAAQAPTEDWRRARLYSAYLAKGKGRVEVFDEASVPRIFWSREVVEKPDTKLIRSALESGQDVPGARLTGVDEKHVVIKVNEAAVRELEVQQEIRAALE